MKNGERPQHIRMRRRGGEVAVIAGAMSREWEGGTGQKWEKR